MISVGQLSADGSDGSDGSDVDPVGVPGQVGWTTPIGPGGTHATSAVSAGCEDLVVGAGSTAVLSVVGTASLLAGPRASAWGGVVVAPDVIDAAEVPGGAVRLDVVVEDDGTGVSAPHAPDTSSVRAAAIDAIVGDLST